MTCAALSNAHLLESDVLDEQMRQQLEQMQMEGKLDQLIEQLIERMQQEDYISVDQPHDPERGRVSAARPAPHSRRSSKSPTRVWTSWDTKLCAT